MNKLATSLLLAVLFSLLSFTFASAQNEKTEEKKGTLTGDLLKLSQVTQPPNAQLFTVKINSLVIVHIPHSGSDEPVNVKVAVPDQFQRLGIVKGTQDDDGNVSLHGGYTWHVLKPVTEITETTVSVSYNEITTNSEGKKVEGKKIERAYKIKIEK